METLSFDEVLAKLEYYCAYQERCEIDVVMKLKKMKVNPAWNDKLVRRLKESDFLNEKRFAKLFTSGKFRLKKWGKVKIANTLRAKGVEEDYIIPALNAIDEAEYLNTLRDLKKTKAKELVSYKGYEKNARLARYLMGKGFESALIWACLEENEKAR